MGKDTSTHPLSDFPFQLSDFAWHRDCGLIVMQTKTNKAGRRIKRLLGDEWAMIALLTEALVQTGAALHEMNGMLPSDRPGLSTRALRRYASRPDQRKPIAV